MEILHKKLLDFSETLTIPCKCKSSLLSWAWIFFNRERKLKYLIVCQSLSVLLSKQYINITTRTLNWQAVIWCFVAFLSIIVGSILVLRWSWIVRQKVLWIVILNLSTPNTMVYDWNNLVHSGYPVPYERNYNRER